VRARLDGITCTEDEREGKRGEGRREEIGEGGRWSLEGGDWREKNRDEETWQGRERVEKEKERNERGGQKEKSRERHMETQME